MKAEVTLPTRRFNLLSEGTGIRFTSQPVGAVDADPHRKALMSAALFSVLLVAAVAAVNVRTFTQWHVTTIRDVAPPRPAVEIPDEAELVKKQLGEQPSDRKRIVLDRSGDVVAGSDVMKIKTFDRVVKTPDAPIEKQEPVKVAKKAVRDAPAKEPFREPVKMASAVPPPARSVPKETYHVRFAEHFTREDARAFQSKLGKKGVTSQIRRTSRQLSLYRLKIGPFENRASRKEAVAALRKMGVATLPLLAQQYEVTGRISDRETVGKVRGEMERLSVAVDMETEQKEMTVFDVTSVPCDNRACAEALLEKWRKLDVEGIVEKSDS